MPYDGGSAKVALDGVAYQQISRKALVMPRPNISCAGFEERRAKLIRSYRRTQGVGNVLMRQMQATKQERASYRFVSARKRVVRGAPSRKSIQYCRPTPPDDH